MYLANHQIYAHAAGPTAGMRLNRLDRFVGRGTNHAWCIVYHTASFFRKDSSAPCAPPCDASLLVWYVNRVE